MDRRKGQELVEYALVLPFLILIFAAIIEMAMITFSYNGMNEAARAGARYGIIHPHDAPGIIAAAKAQTTGLVAAYVAVAPSLPGGNVVLVQVTYDYHFVTFLGGVLHLRTATRMDIE